MADLTLADIVSLLLRGASFIAVFQAAGMALFLAAFGQPLQKSNGILRQVVLGSALAGVLLVLVQYSLEAARLAGGFGGVIDPSLQKLAWRAPGGAVTGVRVLGLGLVALASRRGGEFPAACAVIGAALVCASFVLLGHTAGNALRWLLAPLLLVHVLIVAMWFGALLPLYVAAGRETGELACAVTEDFSRVAVRVVPLILGAGLVMGIVLVPSLAVFRQGYGELLLVKIGGYALLMVLAALNKWRLGPALSSGNATAVHRFRRSVAAEYAVMCAVFAVTAVMTGAFPPDS